MACLQRAPSLVGIRNDVTPVTDHDTAMGRFGDRGTWIIPDTFLSFTDRIGFRMA